MKTSFAARPFPLFMLLLHGARRACVLDGCISSTTTTRRRATTSARPFGISSQVLLESSHFDGIKRRWKSRSEPGQTEGRRQTNDDMIYTFGPKIQMGKTTPVDFKPPYSCKLDAASAVKAIVTTHAGVGKGPFASK